MDESELISLAQRGDLTAFNRLVISYQDLAYNVAYRIMSDPASAEDVTQEAFIAAYKALRRFRGGSFKSWLLRIVTNRCYDELRRYKRRPQSSLDELTETSSAYEFLPSDEPGPEEWQQRRDLVSQIENCLDTLPDEQRIVAVLSDVEGHDYQSIAEIMSTSLGTVKSRLSRARQKLRDCLQDVAELLPAEYRHDSEDD
jgi:RNA polymerase sigma-70 factor (ECF subfamily)